MALFDVVQFEGAPFSWLIYKHPGDEFNTHSKLIVAPGQVAILVHNGKIERILEEGSYRLDTELLPFVKAFVKGVFGGNNPYPMNVYFVNKTLKLDMLWGTSDPINIVDPKYGIQLRLRARGQLGIRLANYQFFFQTLVGTIMDGSYITFTAIQNYFRGIINQRVKKILSSFIIQNKCTYFEIDPHIDTIQKDLENELKPDLNRFGFDLVNLAIESINVPDDDLTKLNDIFHKKAEFQQLGNDLYRTSRGYDVLEAGAKNNSSTGAVFGMGLGMGMNGQGINSIIPPSKEVQNSNLICPKCHSNVPFGSKFCPECGSPMALRCPKCQTEVAPGTKFCPNCGQKL